MSLPIKPLKLAVSEGIKPPTTTVLLSAIVVRGLNVAAEPSFDLMMKSVEPSPLKSTASIPLTTGDCVSSIGSVAVVDMEEGMPAKVVDASTSFPVTSVTSRVKEPLVTPCRLMLPGRPYGIESHCTSPSRSYSTPGISKRVVVAVEPV